MKHSKTKMILSLVFVICLLFGSNYLYKKFRKSKVNQPTKEIFEFFDVATKEKNNLISASKAQLKQDVFVYLELNKKENGFFVEFGATDGVALSNSYMLENKFGWRGILAEPAEIWHADLRKNRPKSHIETMCVWTKTGETLSFNETSSSPELSTIEFFSDSDGHKKTRNNAKNVYSVSTISLMDMLQKHHAPKHIDYLSIDTEGSELAILKAFFKENNFYQIKVITCEHNYTKNREKIHQLLASNGYVRKYQQASAWDDFYVLKEELK